VFRISLKMDEIYSKHLKKVCEVLSLNYDEICNLFSVSEFGMIDADDFYNMLRTKYGHHKRFDLSDEEVYYMILKRIWMMEKILMIREIIVENG